MTGVNHACKIHLKWCVKGAAVGMMGLGIAQTKNNKTHTNTGAEPFSESWRAFPSRQVLPGYGVPMEDLEEHNQEQVTSVSISISRTIHLLPLSFSSLRKQTVSIDVPAFHVFFFISDSNKE